MDSLGLVSNRLVASLASARLVLEDGGKAEETRALVLQACDLHQMLVEAAHWP